MKVVSSKQMGYIESQAYRNGSSESAFMENAGRGVAIETDTFADSRGLPHEVVLLCGKGNNAGDAYVAGTHLLSWGYSVIAYQIVPISETSPLAQENHTRFRDQGGLVHEVNLIEEIKLPEKGIIIDGLFGTGFQGTAREPFASIIKRANQSGLPILAIDIPSGLNGDTGIVEGHAIHATETFYLGLPKTGFFLQDGWNHVGKLRYVDFGLPPLYVKESEADLILLTEALLAKALPPVINTRHKYQAGYVIGLAGSQGMPGAAILSSYATLRAGAGIVKLYHPKGMENELTTTPYEVIKVGYDPENATEIIDAVNQATSCFIGPGIGKTAEAKQLLKELLLHIKIPCVIDADALSIIGEEKLTPPEGSVLTPHAGEMIRLMRRSAPGPHTQEFLSTCQKYSEDHRVTIVLKGGPTFLFHPHETIRVNAHSDPGMATAGSGDVLTGIIAGLLAQGLTPHAAASLGIFLHGLSGEFAAEEYTSYSLIASDLIESLPDAFKHLLNRHY
jgi:ADP-dependent NAD(P)H-hydrate dehydratase / NAD(P)H-hydrate epimerase